MVAFILFNCLVFSIVIASHCMCDYVDMYAVSNSMVVLFK